jgi:hypothetical protein
VGPREDIRLVRPLPCCDRFCSRPGEGRPVSVCGESQPRQSPVPPLFLYVERVLGSEWRDAMIRMCFLAPTS